MWLITSTKKSQEDALHERRKRKFRTPFNLSHVSLMLHMYTVGWTKHVLQFDFTSTGIVKKDVFAYHVLFLL